MEGLKELATDKDNQIRIEVANFLLENTLESKDYFVRAKATSNLAKFLVSKNETETQTPVLCTGCFADLEFVKEWTKDKDKCLFCTR
ncbi:MAG: hypothetical protein P0116_09645 [Candidatus Nitrosocosmicus sp.]|nr:hypothetical protein [Candidatus Nitrosocosmicus sp.]